LQRWLFRISRAISTGLCKHHACSLVASGCSRACRPLVWLPHESVKHVHGAQSCCRCTERWRDHLPCHISALLTGCCDPCTAVDALCEVSAIDTLLSNFIRPLQGGAIATVRRDPVTAQPLLDAEVRPLNPKSAACRLLMWVCLGVQHARLEQGLLPLHNGDFTATRRAACVSSSRLVQAWLRADAAGWQ
jgi:hypothetical protein